MKKKKDISTRDFHLATFLNVSGFKEPKIEWITSRIHYFVFPYSKKLEKFIDKYQDLLWKEKTKLSKKRYIEEMMLKRKILLKLSKEMGW